VPEGALSVHDVPEGALRMPKGVCDLPEYVEGM
jgi:hypothetical protein